MKILIVLDDADSLDDGEQVRDTVKRAVSLAPYPPDVEIYALYEG